MPELLPQDLFGEIDPPQRLLMGPGPINAHPRVLRAMAADLLGQFDPEDFLDVGGQAANDDSTLLTLVHQSAHSELRSATQEHYAPQTASMLLSHVGSLR